MAVIQVKRNHGKSIDEVRVKVEELIVKLQHKLQVRSEWQSDNTLVFQRKGAKGEIEFDETTLELTLRLGMMLRALKKPIETEIHAVLDKFLK
ncbi:hypothetical protein FLL45_21775 [Aliikangiella marina]|uniref:Polyhydroxyalkanoic acid system protein n=1 Tax=Aliikangiella marina TaxID=1712262 RepID=A0A545T189_9GAMM|nr:polyhydroxyalkanoic acid system family protein [Aliikangiella marina]TQV70959.1 hypothetical protein FLL45_21775 [Aliikangiella marina]